MERYKKQLLAVLGIVLIGFLFWLARINNWFSSVQNYDDCVAAGGEVVQTQTPYCRINGHNFSSLGSEKFPGLK